MKIIQIRRIYIDGFKLFSKFKEDFDSDTRLVVFDGANGFGKTSFYDAVELLFTGKIRRYQVMVDEFVSKAELFEGHPWVQMDSKTDMVIKMEFCVNDTCYVLMRKARKDDDSKKKKLTEFSMQLYQLNAFDDSDGNLISPEKEKEFLAGIIGENYVDNFQFLSYVEQEENLCLLKKTDKDREENINYLINTQEFSQKIDKLSAISEQIGTLCSKKAKDEISAFKTQIADLQKDAVPDAKQVEYFRLLDKGVVNWDEKDITFKDGRYSEILSEIKLVQKFIENLSDYKKMVINDDIDNMLRNDGQLKMLLQYYTALKEYDANFQKKQMQDKINAFFKGVERGLLEAIDSGVIAVDQFAGILGDRIDISQYNVAIKNIANARARMNETTKIMGSLMDVRQSLQKKFLEYANEHKSKECPFCGHNWGDLDKLKNSIAVQEENLEKLVGLSGDEIKRMVFSFEEQYIKEIRLIFEEYVKKNGVDIEFWKSLSEAKKQKGLLDSLNEKIQQLGVDITPLFSIESDVANKNLVELKSKLANRKEAVDVSNMHSYADIFARYFKKDNAVVEKIDSKRIQDKVMYIEWQYSIFKSDVIKEKQHKLDELNKTLETAEKIKKRIDALKKVYADSESAYQKKIINDLGVLFHIYSGRIVQDTQNGVGLFLDRKDTKKGIRFKENPNKDFDALFTMSTGQLSALIISFTLALNKKYSQNKLLFIDDPVQTMDELNIAGLVELLRNDFSDRQIFLSTHEDKMSAYMRYKFDKFGIKVDNLNFKDIYLSAKGRA